MENPDDLHAILSKQFDALPDAEQEAQAEAATQADTQGADEPEPGGEESEVETPEQPEGEQEEGDVLPDGEEQPQGEAEKPAEQEEEPDPVTLAPSSWTAKGKEEFSKLPRSVQEEVHRRESNYHEGLQRLKPQAHFGQVMQRVLEPFQQTLTQLQQQGIDAPTALQKLLHADHKLRYSRAEEKAAFLAEIAHDYGIDMGQVATQPAPNPEVMAMRRQMEQIQMQRQQELQAQQQNDQTRVMSEIEKFAADPKNEHFNAVRDQMANLLQSGQAQTLEDAYEKAIWTQPEIRQSLLERQTKEAQQKALQTAQRNRTKAAAVSPRGNRVAKAGRPAGKDDLRGLLEDLIPH